MQQICIRRLANLGWRMAGEFRNHFVRQVTGWNFIRRDAGWVQKDWRHLPQ